MRGAHEVPSDVTVRMLVRPRRRAREGARARAARGDAGHYVPDVRTGLSRCAASDSQLRDAAQLWLVDNLELYEGERRVPLAIVGVRASIPSDRSFAEYDSALAHLRAPPLPAGLALPWQQALLDVELEAPIESASSLFSLNARTQRLGMRVVNAVRFFGASGVERVFQIEGDAGVVALDPRWHQSLLRFLVQGFEHILDGADHLLFLLCLVVPFRRQVRALVWIVTAFTAGHSVTLIASAYGLAPSALWFPPLVETLIALSIFYMTVENVVCPKPRARWAMAFGFGLVHGFGFSFALQNTLQFAGAHVLTSLLVVQRRHRARPAARARAARAGAESAVSLRRPARRRHRARGHRGPHRVALARRASRSVAQFLVMTLDRSATRRRNARNRKITVTAVSRGVAILRLQRREGASCVARVSPQRSLSLLARVRHCRSRRRRSSRRPAEAAAPDEITIKIIGFNDYHGNLQSPGTFGLNTDDPAAQRPAVGGAEYMAAYVAQAEGARTRTTSWSAPATSSAPRR